MVKLPQQETKALVALHGWSAVLLGFLLYAVVVTGTVAVFAEEILHWSIGDVQKESAFIGDVDGVVSRLATQVEPKFLEEVGLGSSPRGNLEIFFHTHRKKNSGELEDYGVQFEVDASSGEVLSRQLGTAESLFHNNQYAALSRFLVSIHTELHLPRPWGLLLTGILGLAMLVAAISGILMHRHLFKDIFVLRRDANPLLKKRDIHTVAGTWSLPFAFILAFTGSFFSFAGAFGIPAMAMVSFGGDQEAMIRTIVGMPETESNVEVKTANLNTLIRHGSERVGDLPRFMSISHYGREDAKVLTFFEAVAPSVEPRQLEYAGVSGNFVREKPSLGLVPSAGATAFSWMGPLHFGNFAGVLSKIVWVALGFAGCYVIYTGLVLWTHRRGESWALFRRFIFAFGLGTPIAMLFAAYGFFLAFFFKSNANAWVPIAFLLSAALILVSALWHQTERFRKVLTYLSIALAIGLPVLRYFSTSVGWLDALQAGNVAVPFIDCVLSLIAGLGIWSIRGSQGRASETHKSIDMKVLTQTEAMEK